ncbi:MAG: hypothetical protein E7491_07760 [Ruminococcaceae bacterium]|nr:hypothetical protein [Oscillospiraceae bacterium]
MKTTYQDMALLLNLHPYTTPAAAPVTFSVGGTVYRGIPDAFSPKVKRRRIDACITETSITAKTPEGLDITVECTEFSDYPVVEWVMYISNNSGENSPVISDWHIDLSVPCPSPCLYHGNGDTCRPDGYEWQTDTVTADTITKMPCGDGTPCNGAFPYMRLLGEGGGVNIAVGWSGTWRLDVKAESIDGVENVRLTAGQASFRSYLKSGETVRSPRLTLQAYSGDDARGRNLWRSFYIDHFMPRENGQPLAPKLVLHTWMIDGLPEFCGVTEKNQISAIDTYIKGGLRPDIWWIDAGWYPCNNFWPGTGTWHCNPEHFPNGMHAVGEKCAAEGIDLLLWFEPERVFPNTQLWNERPDLLLFRKDDSDEPRDALLNYANPAAVDWAIETFDGIIKEAGVKIYRQDFNTCPAPYWAENAEPDREGLLENLHIQGYYRFWDTLLMRNPGLWIDSCASGGRRNDPETMRRAVPLHYTDVGYGDHYIKQKQHREMFEWIPYFRAHNYNWDEPNGEYNGQPHGIDDFGYHNALAPVLTSMIEYYHGDEIYAVGRRFHPVWRRAAQLELTCDYYPLTECRKDTSDWYAMQFDGDDEGFIQIIRNVRVAHERITLTNLHIDTAKTYTFTDELGKRSFSVSGARLAKEGFSDVLPHRSGVIWFYTKAQ